MKAQHYKWLIWTAALGIFLCFLIALTLALLNKTELNLFSILKTYSFSLLFAGIFSWTCKNLADRLLLGLMAATALFILARSAWLLGLL